MVAQIAPVAGARTDAQRRLLDAQAAAQLTGAVRLVSADAEAAIERFSDPHLLAVGKINIISRWKPFNSASANAGCRARNRCFPSLIASWIAI